MEKKKAWICAEIVSRADEDFSDKYGERAWSHFESAVAMLLGGAVEGLNETDFNFLVETAKLELGVNCKLPHNTAEDVAIHNMQRVLGVYYFKVAGSVFKGCKLVADVGEFNKILNNPFTKRSEWMYVYVDGNSVMVWPYFGDCYIRYLRKLGDRCEVTGDSETDVVAERNLGDGVLERFSDRFIWAAIDAAVASFKGEVTVQEFNG